MLWWKQWPPQLFNVCSMVRSSLDLPGVRPIGLPKSLQESKSHSQHLAGETLDLLFTFLNLHSQDRSKERKTSPYLSLANRWPAILR